mmetsp:Transcript_31056/g.62672  ORF Transcript_31056/g.62672 Transcript_31056/m.62672 type:complete len:442 (-) Transcript_31056:129-1454(-)
MPTSWIAISVWICLFLSAHGEDAGILQPRSCDFYESHAYPATYNVDLNVTCGVSASAPLARHPAFTQGLGLFASRDFPDGEVIAWVPESAHIWEPSIPWSLRHAVAEACEPRAYGDSVLAVSLLVERRDANSRFKHYVAALAQITIPEVGNIVSFTDDHLSVLSASRLDLTERFQGALRCIEAAGRSIDALRTAPPSRGEQLWAYGVVRTRALKLRGRLALIPVIDLANHAATPNAEVGVQEPGGGGILRSLRKLALGEEVTISYGRKASNLELLATHGFVMQPNPVGPLLPVDFTVAIALGSDETSSSPDTGGACKGALSSPHLQRAARLLLDAQSAQCLEERLLKYYEHHPAEIDVLSPLHLEVKGAELLGMACRQVLEEYRKVASVINRLQQHGQRVQDWLMLQVAHEAAEDMRLLKTCSDAAKAHDDGLRAEQRNDL